MRKCYLCGAVLRRRAEFCRFCTARQPDATMPSPSTPVGPGGAVPPPWLLPAPPQGATSSSERRGAAFQPTWDVIAEVRVDPPTEIELEAVTARADEAPARYDDPVAARVLHPPTENPVLTDRPAPAPATDAEVRPTNGRRHATNGTDGGTNGASHTTDGRSANGRSTNGRSTNGTSHATDGGPTNGTRARVASGRTTKGTNGHPTEVVPATVAATKADAGAGRPAPTTPAAAAFDPSDPLLGFEHFPDAPPAPEIRWG